MRTMKKERKSLNPVYIIHHKNLMEILVYLLDKKEKKFEIGHD